jgi:tRNA threonylcarbamoyladenosine biosynthesis protein TsaB
MKVLAVDTATAWQSVAILDGTTALARHDGDAPGAHAKTLLPTIDRLFSETGLSIRKLNGLVVSIGPGSFTGLRVGLATILGFRTISQLPLAVVPTLEGMAWNLRGSSMPLCPILNSRKGELYWAVFRWLDNDRLERIVPEQVGSPPMLADSLTQPVVCYGEGWTTGSAAIRAAIQPSVTIAEAPVSAMRPSAVSIGLAGIVKLQRGEQAGLGVSPFYVQRAEAELKYEASGGVSPVARRQAKIARKLGGRLTAAGSRRGRPK